MPYNLRTYEQKLSGQEGSIIPDASISSVNSLPIAGINFVDYAQPLSQSILLTQERFNEGTNIPLMEGTVATSTIDGAKSLVAYSDTSGTIVLIPSPNGNITMDESTVPSSEGYDLGSQSSRWENIYVDAVGASEYYIVDGNNITNALSTFDVTTDDITHAPSSYTLTDELNGMHLITGSQLYKYLAVTSDIDSIIPNKLTTYGFYTGTHGSTVNDITVDTSLLATDDSFTVSCDKTIRLFFEAGSTINGTTESDISISNGAEIIKTGNNQYTILGS